jgi:hypothetical protein
VNTLQRRLRALDALCVLPEQYTGKGVEWGGWLWTGERVSGVCFHQRRRLVVPDHLSPGRLAASWHLWPAVLEWLEQCIKVKL